VTDSTGRPTSDDEPTGDDPAAYDPAGVDPAGVDPAADDPTARSRHLRGSSLLLVGRVGSMVFTTATQVVVVRALTKDDFGAFAFALAIASASRFVLSLGQGKTLSRFLAVYLEDRDFGRLLGSIVIAVGTVLVTGALLVGAVALLPGVLVEPFVQGDEAARVLLILVLLAPLEALDQVFVSLFAVFTKPRAIFFRKYLLTPGLRLVVVLVLAATGASVTFLALGYVAVQVLGMVLYVILLRSVLREQDLLRHLRLRGLRWPFRNVLTFALPMLSTDLVFLSMNTGSVLLLSHEFGAVAVAEYRAVFPAATLNKIVYTTFLTLYLPMVSRLFARQDHEGIRADYWRTAVFLAVFSFPVFAMTGPFAEATTVTLFDTRYASSATVLALLSVGYYLNSALGFNMVTLQAYGKVRLLFLVNIGAALLNLALSIALIPDFGAVGVAVANAVTLTLQNVAYQLGLRRTARTGFINRGSLPAYASIAVAAGLLWGVQVLWSPGLVVSLVLTALTSLALLAVNRRSLQLSEYFPEVRRLPLVGRYL
jgi:O-antigen/teichoic acid export membrane protein